MTSPADVDLPDWVPLRDDLRRLPVYGAPQLDVAVRLNTNENPHPPPPGLVADLTRAVAVAGASLQRYPDRDATALREELAGYLARETRVPLAREQVWAANGSNELLQQVLLAFGGPGRSALGFEPGYAMHRLISLATATGWTGARRGPGMRVDVGRALDAVAAARPDVVLLSSPNNPTGTALDLDVVDALHEAVRGVVVVDEAYAEFRRAGTPSAVSLLAGRPRLVVTRTLSKAFSLAGARVGYLAADPALVRALLRVRLPYHLSSLSQAAARVALQHTDALLGTVHAVMVQRDRLVEELGARGFDVFASDANFVLFGGLPDAPALWRALLEHGVLVRDVGVPGALRVTAGLDGEVGAFLLALDAVARRAPELLPAPVPAGAGGPA